MFSNTITVSPGGHINIIAGDMMGGTGGDVNLNAGDGATDGSININNNKSLKFFDESSGTFAGFSAATTTLPNVVWQLPTTAGTVGQVLGISSGTQLGWTNAASSMSTYFQIKDTTQSIPTATPTTLTGWDVVGSSTYHTIPEWDLVTGVYTSSANGQILSANIIISWDAGVSNLGNRMLQAVFYDDSASTTTVIAKVQTQADASTAEPTSQQLCIQPVLDLNDQIYFQVQHSAPVNLSISGSNQTILSGYKI